LYSLYGVVEHSGRLTGGHYTAYVKARPESEVTEFLSHGDLHSSKLRTILTHIGALRETAAAKETGKPEGVPPTGKWFYISDSRVSEATETSVLRCQAYILFYERYH